MPTDSKTIKKGVGGVKGAAVPSQAIIEAVQIPIQQTTGEIKPRGDEGEGIAHG
jgi:hypothetical protein